LNIYADSSFIVSLYLPDEHTPKVERLMRENPRLFLTPYIGGMGARNRLSDFPAQNLGG